MTEKLERWGDIFMYDYILEDFITEFINYYRVKFIQDFGPFKAGEEIYCLSVHHIDFKVVEFSEGIEKRVAYFTPVYKKA